MSKNKYDISDRALSRSLWRKAISIDDEITQAELHKWIFSAYQKQLVLDNEQASPFPTCVQNEKLRKALFSLTTKQQKVIELYYFQDMTQADVAQTLCCSQVAVSKILLRAIEKIKTNFSCE